MSHKTSKHNQLARYASRREQIKAMSEAPASPTVTRRAHAPARRDDAAGRGKGHLAVAAAVCGLVVAGGLAYLGTSERSASAQIAAAIPSVPAAASAEHVPAPRAEAQTSLTEKGVAAYDPAAYPSMVAREPVLHPNEVVRYENAREFFGTGAPDDVDLSADTFVSAEAGDDSPAGRPRVSVTEENAAAVEMVEHAEVTDLDALVDGDSELKLVVAGTHVVTTRRPLSRVSVGSADVAEVNTLSPETVLITAKQPGETQLILWDDDQTSQTVQVVVEPDLGALRRALEQMFPTEDIEVMPVSNAIGIKGRVRSLMVAQQVANIAGRYGPVLNMLEVGGGQQVMLKVRFAEVSRRLNKELGFNFAFSDGATLFGSNFAGAGQIQLTPGGFGSAGATVGAGTIDGLAFGQGSLGDNFAYFVDALKEANLLRTLSEPTLTVISGQKGTFLAGGEIPVPVPNESGVAIEYKEFGVRLDYTPTVLGDGRIRLDLEPSSSQLDFANAVQVLGTLVPGLTSRELSTTVEMMPGQTLVIGGLLNKNVVANRQAVPLLGELPWIGGLFRSVRYQRQETELVVMIEPMLVAPIDADRAPKMPGEQWEHPTDAELFGEGYLGRDPNASRKEPRPGVAPTEPAAGAPVLTQAEPAEPVEPVVVMPEVVTPEPIPGTSEGSTQTLVILPAPEPAVAAEPQPEPAATPRVRAVIRPLVVSEVEGSGPLPDGDGFDLLGELKLTTPVSEGGAETWPRPMPPLQNAVPVEILMDPVEPRRRAPAAPVVEQPTLQIVDTVLAPVVAPADEPAPTAAAEADAFPSILDQLKADVPSNFRQETHRATSIEMVERKTQAAKTPVRQVELPAPADKPAAPADKTAATPEPAPAQSPAADDPTFIGGFGFDD